MVKIAKQTDTVLVLKSPALGWALLGILILGIGVIQQTVMALHAFDPAYLATHPYGIGAASFGTAVTLIIIGGFLIWHSQSRRTVFDKTTGQMTIRATGFFRRSKIQYALVDIAQVEIREQPQDQGVTKVTWHHLRLLFKNGSRLAITNRQEQSTVLFGASKLDKERLMGQQIATFLGVPFTQDVTELPRGQMGDLEEEPGSKPAENPITITNPSGL